MSLYKYLIISLLAVFVSCEYVDSRYKRISNAWEVDKKSKESREWKGRWFPENPHARHNFQNNMNDIHPECDEDKNNSTKDWNPKNILEFMCLKQLYGLDISIAPVIRQDIIPPYYNAPHVCMDQEIQYKSGIPTFGAHRPRWARYGEYEYLPPQRWLHNLEHGAVVMLYHPCAHPVVVSHLRNITKSCLFRHIITPYSKLPEDRPVALVTWGWSLSMNFVSEKLAKQFIEEHAIKAPEDIITEGSYDFRLKVPATIVSDFVDSDLCPKEIKRDWK